LCGEPLLLGGTSFVIRSVLGVFLGFTRVFCG
jgi:hypothetical protein